MSNNIPRREIRPGEPRPAPVNDQGIQGLAAEGKSLLNRPVTGYILHGAPHDGDVPASPGALMAAALAGVGPATPGALMAAALAGATGNLSMSSSPLQSPRSLTHARCVPGGVAAAAAQVQTPIASMYPMASSPDTSTAGSHAVTMTRHKPPLELSPLKQRAMAFRTGITKSTLWMQPDFKGGTVLETALDYALPAKAGVPTLSPALLADLRQSVTQPTGVTSASLMGTYTLPSGGTQRLFSNTSKLPFHGASAGALGAPGAGMTHAMLLLAPQLSQAEAHNFDVPSHVKTGLDAVKLFASSGAKEGLIVFCNLNPKAADYNPYDLVVVDRADVEPSFFYVLTQTGVTHMWGGVAYDLTPHHVWIRDAELFAVLKKLVLFKKRPLFMAFRTWHASVRALRFARRKQRLADTLLVLSPTFGKALMHIRRMTLTASEDPAGTWKQRQLGGGRVGWVQVGEGLFPEEPVHHVQDDSDGDESGSQDSPGAAHGLTSIPGVAGTMVSAAPQPASADALGTAGQVESRKGSPPRQASPPSAARADMLRQSQSQLRQQSEMGGALVSMSTKSRASIAGGPGGMWIQHGPSMRGNADFATAADAAAAEVAAGVSAATAAGAPQPLGNASTGGAVALEAAVPGPPLSPGRGQPSDVGGRQSVAGSASTGAMAVTDVLKQLLQRGEALPTGGLAAQLGHIGGAQDTYSLSEFRKLRAEAKAAVQTSLAQMVQYVVGQVQAVGALVATNLREASSAVARPTKREAREKRFAYTTGKDAWRARSQALAREADNAHMRNLAAARWDRDKLPAFLLLADALVLTAMTDLSRLSLATAVNQIFLHRRQGLFLVSGEVQSALAHQDEVDEDAPGNSKQQSAHPSYNGMGPMYQTARSTVRQVDTTLSMMSRMTGATSAPGSSAGHRPPVVFVPSAEDLCGALYDVVRDVLAVAAQAALGLGMHPEVRAVMRELLGSTHAMYAATGGAPQGNRSSANGRDAGTMMGAGGRPGMVIELLRASLGAAALVDRITEQVERQYMTVLRHYNLRPYVGHEVEWALVCSFEPAMYRAANHLPDRLQSDLLSVRTWLEDLAKHRTTSVHALLHFDMLPVRAMLMPRVGKTYAELMSSLTTHMMTVLKDLLARLARYIDRLRNRPSELPEFVAHTEATWPHLEENGFKRQRVRFMHEHLGKLYAVIMAAVPKADASPTRRATQSRPGSASGEVMAVPEVAVSVKDARPVHMLWKQVQAEVARYHEECVAAADFFQHSSALMTNHLKNSLLQMESDLLQMLHTLRLGMSTSVTSKFQEVQQEMQRMEQQLVLLGEQYMRCTAWAKLLSHATVMQTLTRSGQLMDAARAVLVGRQALWRVLHRWEGLCDELYTLPCTHRTADGLLLVLESVLADLDEQVAGIKVLHVSDDVSDTSTATPQEAKLGAHFALVVNAWKDMLPYAQRLCDEGVKPRHVHILLTWLKVCHTPPDHAHVADVVLAERYMVPVVHVSKPLEYVPQPAAPVKKLDAFADAEEEAETVTFAQLLSRVTESAETRALADRALEVAAAEHRLLGALNAINARVSRAQVEFSAHRTFGAFVITNGDEVLAELRAIDSELGAVRTSPQFGAVMAAYEVVEQLVAWVTGVMRSALKCQDLWMWLSGLMSNSEVLSCAQDAMGAWERLAAVWRKFSLSAKERPSLPQCATVIQEVEVLQEAMAQVVNMVAASVLPSIRTAFPRAYFVPDRVLLEALAVAGDVSLLPPTLLGACFHGLAGLSVLQDEPSMPSSLSPLSPGSGLSLASPSAASNAGAPMQQSWGPQEVLAAVGSSGELMDIVMDLVASPGKALASFLSDLELSLRASVKAHTKGCIEACGHMQADKWVSAFPTQCVVLVDAMVWTQAVTAALTRASGGERGALRNLCDQSVLRLETLAHQLRVAQAAAAAAERARPSGSGRSASPHEAVPDLELAAAQQTARGLQALIAAGAAHRQVVEALVAGDVSGPDSFEWLRQVRHYWDADQDILYIAFAQTRLPYGWEYQGGPVDIAPTVLPVSQPGLLSAVNALQTSPVVGLSLASGQGSGRAAVSAMASLVGKFWVGAELGPDTTPATSARILAGALASDCWLSLDGAAGLSLQVLSTLGQQLGAVWSAFYYGTPSISLPGAPSLIPSPWVRASQADAPAPASVFVSLPASAYLVPGHEALLGGAHVGPSQLSETLRRLARVVTLSAPDCSLLLEAGLRCMGLRDAPEGTRIVGAVMRLVAMQLPPRPQYRYDVLTVYALLACVHGPGPLTVIVPPTPAHGVPTASRASSAASALRGDQAAPGTQSISAVDAVELALRAVLVGAAEPGDVPLLVRLIDQSVSSSAPRTPAGPDTPAASVPPTPMRPSMLPTPSAAALAGSALPGQSSGSPYGLPNQADLRAALDKICGASLKSGPSAAMGGPGSQHPTPMRRQTSKQVATSVLPDSGAATSPDNMRTVLPLAATNRDVLSSAAASLSAMLGVSGTCILVGRPGIGKSTVWRTLALACATAALASSPPLSAGAGASSLSAQLQIAHIYPEALPLPKSVLPHTGPNASSRGAQVPASVVEEWAEVLLNEAPSWQLKQPRCAQLDVLPTPGGGGPALGRVPSVPVGEGGPEWVVFDGPLGTPAAEALVPLLTGRAAHQSAGVASVLGLKQRTKVVWEASSLAGASPLLLSAAPVLCISSNIVDLDGALVQEGVYAAVRRLVGGSAKATAVMSKGPISLMCAAFARAAPILGASAAGASSSAAASSMGTANPTGANTALSPGVEHGAVMLSSAARGAISIFTEVVAGLDVPPGASAGAQLLLGRAALYALYWALACLPLEAPQRQAMEAAIKEAAAVSDMSRALPRGGSIGGFLLGPKAGDWCPWTAALEPIMSTRSGLHHPLPDTGSKHGPGGAARWHMFTDPLSGEHRFFVPSGLTVALQHIAALVLRAGGHPVVVGSVGTGRATLLRHLLATGTVSPQTRTDVVGVTLSPLTQPGELSEMVAWRLTAGAGPCTVRPTLGHRLVVLVEDLSAVAQAHAPVEPSLAASADEGGWLRAVAAGVPTCAPAGTSSEVVAPCLEWMRQLLDSGSLVGGYGGMYQALSTQGVSIAATSRVSYFVSGSQQVSPRVWRHLHPLHINAAAAADLASGTQASTAGGNPILTTFSRSALLNAVAHYTLLDLATGHARIPELRAIGPLGVGQAAKVLAITLEKLMGCVQHLVRAHLLPHAWHFGTAGMLAITARLRAAAAHVEPGAWRISDVVQRLVFEVGREVSNGAVDERSKDVLSRVLLHAMGRELGAMMTGKFEFVIRAHNEALAAQASAASAASAHAQHAHTHALVHPPPPASSPTASPLPAIAPVPGGSTSADHPSARDAATTPVAAIPAPASQAPQPAAPSPLSQASHAEPKPQHSHHNDGYAELVELWHSYMTDADGPAMTALRVSLIGKISPSDIDKLLAVVRADLAHMAVASTPVSRAGGTADRGSLPADGAGAPGAAGALQATMGSGQHEAVGQGQSSLLEGGQPRWPRWLHHLPVPQEDLCLKVAALSGMSHLPPPLSRRAASRPGSALVGHAASQDLGAPGGVQQGAEGRDTEEEGAYGQSGRRAASASDGRTWSDSGPSITIIMPGDAQDRSSSASRMGGAALDQVNGELCLYTLTQWEYASTLAAAAHQLVEGFYAGGNLLLSGPDVHALLHIARLAALSVDASMLTLDCSMPGKLDWVLNSVTACGCQKGAANVTSLSIAAAARPGSLRHQLLQLLQEVASHAHSQQGLGDQDTDTNGGSSTGDFWSASRFDDLSSHEEHTGAAPLAAGGPQRYVLVVGEEAAADEGVLELLQQLVCWPASATHLHAASASEAATRRFKTQVSRLMLSTAMAASEDAYGEDGDVLMGSNSRPSSAAANHGGAGVTSTSGRPVPRDTGFVLEGLRNLMASRSLHIPSAFGELTPGSGFSPRSPRGDDTGSEMAGLTGPRRAIAQAAGLNPTVVSAGSNQVRQLPRRAASQTLLTSMSGRMTYDEVVGLAQARVEAKREAEEDKARISRATLRHVLRRLRIVLALSPASASALRIRFPQLARTLGTVAVPSPSQAAQERAAQAHLQAAANTSTGALLDNSVPAHPEDRVHAVSSMLEERSEAAQLAARVLRSEDEGQTPPDEPSTVALHLEQPTQAEPSRPEQAKSADACDPDAGQQPEETPDRAAGEEAQQVLQTTTVVGTPPALSSPPTSTHGPADELAAVRAGAQAEALDEVERASTVAALSKVLVQVHSQAQKLMWQSRMLPRTQPLPHSKVGDVVEVLGRLHAAQRKLLRSRQAALWVALQKLGRSAATISHGAADVPALVAAIDVRARQLSDKSSKLAVVEGYMDQLSTELSAQEALVSENSAVVAAVTAEVDTALEAAQRRYRQALQEVGGLTEGDLAELRSYTNPPERVRLVMMAVAALFNVPPDWRSAQRLLGEQNPKLLERLVSFEPRALSVMALAKMMRIISEPEFNIVSVAQVSQAAKPLCWWVLSTAELLRVGHEADLKRSKIAEAEMRLEAATKYTRQLRGELKAARNEAARLAAARDAAEADISEMRALINDAELAASNVRRLGDVVGRLTKQWELELKEVEAAMPTLLGDTTLAAAAVVYLGPLLPSQRAAALGSWHKLLQGAGVPVSDSFDLHTFLAARERQLLAPIAHDVLAAATPAMRESLVLANIASRPPLLLDAGRESSVLVKALHGGRTSQRAFLTIQDENLADKVRAAVAHGKVVFLDLLQIGEAGASTGLAAGSVAGAAAEARVLQQVAVQYEDAMRAVYSNRSTAPHKLYIRLRPGATQLPALLHGLFTPVLFAYEREQLEARMVEAVLGCLGGQDTLVELHELVTQQWEVVRSHQEVGESVAFSIAHTRGPVFSDSALVDATCARCGQQDELHAQINPLRDAIKELSDKACVGQRGLLDAAHTAHDMLQYLAAQDVRSTLPDHLFLPLMRAAAKSVLAAAQLAHDADASRAPTPDIQLSARPGHKNPGAHSKHSGSSGLSATSSKEPGKAGKGLDRYGRPASLATKLAKLKLHQKQAAVSVSSRMLEAEDSTVSADGLNADVDGSAAEANGSADKTPNADRALGQEDLYLPMLQALSQVLCACLPSCHAAAFRLLLGLQAMVRRGDITPAELEFTLTLLREGREGVTAAAAGAAGPGAGATQGRSPTKGPGGQPIAQPSQPSLFSSLVAISSAVSLESDSSSRTGFDAPSGPSFPSSTQQKDLSWLERAFPAPVFQGIRAAITSAPDAWRAALWHDDLSRPWAVAAAAAAATSRATVARAQVQAGASLVKMASALDELRAAMAQASVAAEGSSSNLAAAAAAGPTLVQQASMLQLPRPGGAAAGGLRPAAGPLPEHWAAARLHSPLHWFVLVALIAPAEQLAPAAEWLANVALRAPMPTPTPGERVLVGTLPLPPATPVFLASMGTEDALAAVYAAQAAISNGVTGIVEVPRGARLGEREVVTHYWDASHFRDVKSALAHAMRHGLWLLLLNAHTAPPSQLLELLEILSAKEYLLRGDEVAFRVILSLPYAALGSLPPVVRQQGVAVVLEPPTSLASHARAMVQLLAHPISSYVGYFAKPADRELQVAGLGVCLALGVLGRTLASASPPGAPFASPFGWWDTLHAVHLVRLVVAEARKYDPGLESHPLDYGRLRELLLADVFLPACPAPHLAPHTAAVVGALVSDSALSHDYPVHLLAADRDADAVDGGPPPTEPWPFHITGLRDVQAFLARLMEPPPLGLAASTALATLATATTSAAAAAMVGAVPVQAAPAAGPSIASGAHKPGSPASALQPHPQSVAAGGRWPLSLILRYNSSAQLAAAAAASTSLQLHLARCSRPPPSLLTLAESTVVGVEDSCASVGSAGAGTSTAPTPRTMATSGIGSARPSTSGLPHQASRPSATSSKAPWRLTETAPEAVARVSCTATALMPAGGSASDSRADSDGVEVSGIQATLGALSAAVSTLSDLHKWAVRHQVAATRALAALSIRLALDTSKPRALASSWDTLGIESLAQEARLLTAALTHVARQLAHLCLVASDPFANGSETSAAAGQLLVRGFVPACWYTALMPSAMAAGDECSSLPLTTLTAWQQAAEVRTALLCTAAGLGPIPRAPLPASAPITVPEHMPGLWAGSLDLSALALPLAPLAVITRAHSAEHCVHIANVVCRVVPAGAAPTVTQHLGSGGVLAPVAEAGPQATGNRRGLGLSGLWLRDAGLVLIDDGSQAATAGGPTPSEVLQVADVRAGASMAHCTGLVVVPTAADPRMRGGASRPITHSRAGRTTPSAASAVAAGISQALMAPGTQLPLAISVAVSPWGALAADTCATLQVEARAPFVVQEGSITAAAGADTAAAGPGKPGPRGAGAAAAGRAAAVSAAAAAAPNARGLCFLVQSGSGTAAAWVQDRAALMAVAQE